MIVVLVAAVVEVVVEFAAEFAVEFVVEFVVEFGVVAAVTRGVLSHERVVRPAGLDPTPPAKLFRLSFVAYALAFALALLEFDAQLPQEAGAVVGAALSLGPTQRAKLARTRNANAFWSFVGLLARWTKLTKEAAVRIHCWEQRRM